MFNHVSTFSKFSFESLVNEILHAYPVGDHCFTALTGQLYCIIQVHFLSLDSGIYFDLYVVYIPFYVIKHILFLKLC